MLDLRVAALTLACTSSACSLAFVTSHDDAVPSAVVDTRCTEKNFAPAVDTLLGITLTTVAIWALVAHAELPDDADFDLTPTIALTTGIPALAFDVSAISGLVRTEQCRAHNKRARR